MIEIGGSRCNIGCVDRRSGGELWPTVWREAAGTESSAAKSSGHTHVARIRKGAPSATSLGAERPIGCAGQNKEQAMCLLRRIASIAVAAMAISGMFAVSASALEVVDEATGEHCSSVTYFDHGGGIGGCTMSATDLGIEIGTPFGMLNCASNLSIRIGENGQGMLTPDLFFCRPSTVDECMEGGIQDNWRIGFTSEVNMEMQLCVVAFGFLTVTCHLPNLTFVQTTHWFFDIRTFFHQSCEGGGNSIEANWNGTALGQGFEVID